MNYFLVAGSLLGFILLAWIAILFGGWAGWQLLRQNGRMLLRLEELEKRLDVSEFDEPTEQAGLPVGSDAPGFALPDLVGKTHTLAQYRGQSLLLIFFNPACGFCCELVPRLAALSRPADTLSHPMGEGRGEGRPLPVIVSTGDAEANRALVSEHKLVCPVLLQKEMEVAAAYKANGTPSGYLIDPEGKIASELAVGADALLALPQAHKSQIANRKSEIGANGDDRTNRFNNRSLARSKIKRDGLKAGTPAPDFTLPRLDGRGDLSLSELRGRPVLLVFSSPTCGPCVELVPLLERFHRAHPDLELVMISKGEPKENRAKIKEHGLTFPVVLQQQWEISRQYAMFATPVAYLINEAGLIVGDVAVGTDSIVELMSKASSQSAGGDSSSGMVVDLASTST
jgi:peroxiredoxin